MACCSACAGSSAAFAAQAAAVAGDALLLRASRREPAGGIGALAGECDALLTFATPGVTEALFRRLAPEFATTDAAARSCAGLAADELAAWRAFHASWLELSRSDVGWMNASPLFNQACGMSRELEAWRDVLRRSCKLAGPERVPGSEIPSAIKWAAAAGITIALVYGVTRIVP